MDMEDYLNEIVELKKYKKLVTDFENWLDSQDKIYSKGTVKKAISILKVSNNIK